MARTTRSAAIHDKSVVEKPAEAVVNKSTKPSKKRKRVSNGDLDAPIAKHPRSDDEHDEEDDPAIKDENMGPAKEESAVIPPSTSYPPLAGESNLRSEDARKILDILEICDTQGLMDRVFPLHDEAAASPSPSPASKPSQDSASLRTMLKEHDEHPLRVLRSAISQLLPISSQPRSRPSQTAEQQLRFCQLALSLLDQASERTVDIEQISAGILFPDENSTEGSGSSHVVGLAPERRRKYALMQTLPSGEWWTSLNSDSTGTDSIPLSELSTANADLVSILPAPSSSSGPVPTLGELTFSKKAPAPAKLPGHRRVKGGHFLDYGPYASFAPSFDAEGAEVGRFGMGQMLWTRIEKGKARDRARLLKQRFQKMSSKSTGDEVMNLTSVADATMHQDGNEAENQQVSEPDKPCQLVNPESETLALILDRLGLEEGVTELLAKNSEALVRLEELQVRRYAMKSGSREVKVDSEEWVLAHKLMDSFTLLASLRPRLPTDLKSTIIPSENLLRSLHKSLPSHTSQGWYGTLGEGRKAALHDDTTVYMSSVPQPLSAAVATTPVVPTPAPAAPVGASNYGAHYAQQYGSYPPQYRGYQAPGYYTNPANPSAPYASAGYPAQHTQQQAQFAWQQAYSQYGAAGSGSASGRGTPQPQASGVPAPFPGYPSAGLAVPIPGRAVANTVIGAKTAAWSSPGMPSMLPPHMRAAAGSPAVGSTSPLVSYGHTAMPAFQPTSSDAT